jgi:hypothetical protein
MDRTLDAVLGQQGKDCLEEGREFRLAHLAAAHGEVTMANATKAADVAVDFDVVGRIGEHEFRFGAFEQPIVGGFIARIPAQQAMATKEPQITGLSDRRKRGRLRHLIFRPARLTARLPPLLQDEVDLRHVEPGQFDIDVEFDQALQFNRQQLLIPAGLLGELVVGQDIGAFVGIAQVR